MSSPEARRPGAEPWPERYRVFDVSVSDVDYDGALDAVVRAARAGRGGLVDHLSVHGLMLARRKARFAQMLDAFHLVAPDGQPVRWALNRFWHVGLEDRVYGPELMRPYISRSIVFEVIKGICGSINAPGNPNICRVVRGAFINGIHFHVIL